jgi:hypothetical protein
MKNSAISAAITQRAGRAASPVAQAALNKLVDAMIDHYVSWREECFAVALSYENWGDAERQDKKLAFSAYVAALDREEHAAATYQRLAERLALV